MFGFTKFVKCFIHNSAIFWLILDKRNKIIHFSSNIAHLKCDSYPLACLHLRVGGYFYTRQNFRLVLASLLTST